MNKQPRIWALLAGPTVTLSLGFGITSEINSFKLFALGIFAGFSFALIIEEILRSSAMLISKSFIYGSLFILAFFVPFFFSEAPKAQQLYGTYGRNLGFLHYLFLTIIFIAFSRLIDKKIVPKFFKSLLLVGTFESIYGIIQFLDLDPVGWKNPDNWVFGTFGNPNYLSSFLALATISALYFFVLERRRELKILYLVIGIFNFGTIFLTSSIQGLCLVVFGLCVLLANLCYTKSKLLGLSLISTLSLFALLILLGIFQRGPFAAVLYQDSVSFRGDYWRAGLQMFEANWIHGVGIDSYGDFYRMYRDSAAANRRGLEIFSNSAHNLLIDLAATGGILLLIAYLMLLGVVVFTIVKILSKNKLVSLEFKFLSILFFMFILQTFISINVPSLAIWGWIIFGLILSYDSNQFNSISSKTEIKKIRGQRFFWANVISFSLLFTILFPFIAQSIELKAALRKNSVSEISGAVLQFPRDSELISGISRAYEKVGWNQEALDLAKSAVEENGNSATAWKLIYTNPLSTIQDKENASKALRRLDPFYTEQFD